MLENELIRGYSPSETEKVKTHLERLLPHLTAERFVIVGGLAIRRGLISRGIDYPQRTFNDLDIIVEEESVVHPSITQDFLVSHHHPDFYFALVDPVSKTKIDVFNWAVPPFSTEKIQFGNNSVHITDLENQLTVTVFDLLKASDEIKRDPKMISDMELMLSVADLKKVQQIWQKREQPTNFSDSVEQVRRLYSQHPEFFKEKPWHKPKPYQCKECINTSDFPLTPMEKVYKVLGYIE